MLNVTSSSDNKSYGLNETIYINVEFSQAVVVDGSPLLKLETGKVDQDATFSSNNGSTLTFSYTVQLDDDVDDLDVHSSGPIDLQGGSIKAQAGEENALLLFYAGDHAGSLAYNKNIE